jgi:hypothetical protein
MRVCLVRIAVEGGIDDLREAVAYVVVQPDPRPALGIRLKVLGSIRRRRGSDVVGIQIAAWCLTSKSSGNELLDVRN